MLKEYAENFPFINTSVRRNSDFAGPGLYELFTKYIIQQFIHLKENSVLRNPATNNEMKLYRQDAYNMAEVLRRTVNPCIRKVMEISPKNFLLHRKTGMNV